MMDNILLLDCTLRDGGMQLEDAYKNGASISFSSSDIERSIRYLTQSAVDIIEIGAIEKNDRDARGFAIYQDIESISKTMVKKGNQKCAALYRNPDTPLDEIPEYREDLCEIVRVMLRYSELQKSLDFCAGLAQKGYKVFVQPAITMRYSAEEIQRLIDAANQMKAFALYIVDSYGYMQEPEILSLFERYDKGLDSSVHIGFHAHNNINLAFSNVKYFLSIPTKRKRIVDACAIGMGQGAGNYQTELAIPYLNQKFGKNYNYGAILDLCELMEPFQLQKQLWGYNVERSIAAMHHTSYKYGSALRERYRLSFREIDEVLSRMPEEYVQRYTQENVEKLIERYMEEKSREGV